MEEAQGQLPPAGSLVPDCQVSGPFTPVADPQQLVAEALPLPIRPSKPACSVCYDISPHAHALDAWAFRSCQKDFMFIIIYCTSCFLLGGHQLSLSCVFKSFFLCCCPCPYGLRCPACVCVQLAHPAKCDAQRAGHRRHGLLDMRLHVRARQRRPALGPPGPGAQRSVPGRPSAQARKRPGRPSVVHIRVLILHLST